MQPVVVAYGAGRDSTAMLIEMWRRGWKPDAILFANVGSEKKDTYEFVPVFNQWLLEHEFPPITVVQYRPVGAVREIEEHDQEPTLPGAASISNTCALKWKIEPQNRWNAAAQARVAWSHGLKVCQAHRFRVRRGISFETSRARAHSARPARTLIALSTRCRMDGASTGEMHRDHRRGRLAGPSEERCYFCPFQQTWKLMKRVLETGLGYPDGNGRRPLINRTGACGGRSASL